MGFFEGLSKKASETYKNTAEKTNKFTREFKLKSLINDDKDRIEEIYIEIGKKVYEKHIREEDINIKSDLIEECSKIDAYAKEIEDMNNEILSLKNLRLCYKCAAEIDLKAKFCPKCGAPQEVKDENANVQEDNSNIREEFQKGLTDSGEQENDQEEVNPSEKENGQDESNDSSKQEEIQESSDYSNEQGSVEELDDSLIVEENENNE